MTDIRGLRDDADDYLNTGIWTSIGLNNVLKGVGERMYQAARNEGRPVEVTIDGVTVATFVRDSDRIVATIDGVEVARYQA